MPRKDGRPRSLPPYEPGTRRHETEEIVALWSDDVRLGEEPTHTLEYDE